MNFNLFINEDNNQLQLFIVLAKSQSKSKMLKPNAVSRADSLFDFTSEDMRKLQKTLSDKYDESRTIITQIREKVLCEKVFERALNDQNDAYYNKYAKQGYGIPRSEQLANLVKCQPTIKEELKQAAEVQVKIKDRNRRMFGGLNSHLKSAQKKIKADAQINKSKSQLINKILQKQKNQAKGQMLKKKTQIEEQIRSLYVKKDQNARQMLKLQNLMLKTQYIQYTKYLQNFLFTKTQPSIAWKCNKPIKNIKSLKSQSQAKIQKLKQSVTNQILMYDEKFLYQKYMIQNEKQYLNNFLNKVSHSKKNFFMTKTEPQILWRPAKMNEQLQKIKEQSYALIDQKQNTLMSKVHKDLEQFQTQKKNEQIYDFDSEQSEYHKQRYHQQSNRRYHVDILPFDEQKNDNNLHQSQNLEDNMQKQQNEQHGHSSLIKIQSNQNDHENQQNDQKNDNGSKAQIDSNFQQPQNKETPNKQK